MLTPALTALFLLLGTPQDPPAPPQAAPVEADLPPGSFVRNGRVCRRERTTGSNRSELICTTASQRERDQVTADRDLQRFREQQVTAECETNGQNCPVRRF